MNAMNEPFDTFDVNKSALARAPQPADEKKKKKIMLVDIDFHQYVYNYFCFIQLIYKSKHRWTS